MRVRDVFPERGSGCSPWPAWRPEGGRPCSACFDFRPELAGTESQFPIRGFPKTIKLIAANIIRAPSGIGGSARRAQFVEDSVGRHQIIDPQSDERCITAPAIFARVSHESCSHGIEIDVPASGQHVLITCHEARLVAALPQGTGALRSLVYVLYISRAERLHQPRYSACGQRCDEQVDMVCHERVCVNKYAIAHGGISQTLQKYPVVAFLEEARLAIVSSLNDVQR